MLVANSSNRALRLGKPTHKRRLLELCLNGALQILDLIDWLIDLFIYLFIYLLIYWFIDLLIDWLIYGQSSRHVWRVGKYRVSGNEERRD